MQWRFWGTSRSFQTGRSPGRAVVGGRRQRFRQTNAGVPKRRRVRIRGVQAARSKREADRGRPVGCSEAESIGMEKTFARVARQADGRAKLEGVGFLGPRQ